MTPAQLAATSTELQQMLEQGSEPIPLANRNTWRKLQQSCNDCCTVLKKLKLGTPRCEKKR